MTTRPDAPFARFRYLQLVRLPNVLTAAADSLAGWLLVGGTLADTRARGCRWRPPRWSSTPAGMALNDCFDFEIDRMERPGRPLPSGRVSPAFAAGLGGLGLVARAAPGLAERFDRVGLVVASVLAAVILAYDAGLKRHAARPAWSWGPAAA